MYDDSNSMITGDSFDDQGSWVVEIGINDESGNRGITVVEGDTFEFADATWRVDKVYEPSTNTRGLVAELTRITGSH